MKDLTSPVEQYREAVRHLWNTYYLERVQSAETFNQKWDIVDQFRQVDKLILSGVIHDELGGHACVIDAHNTIGEFLRVVPTSSGSVPIMVERPSQDGNKYWDDPVDRVEGGQIDLRFVEFFDWNQLAARDFHYYRVKINSFPQHPHFVGREALLEIQYARVFFDSEKLHS
jgi:hypothetical protein